PLRLAPGQGGRPAGEWTLAARPLHAGARPPGRRGAVLLRSRAPAGTTRLGAHAQPRARLHARAAVRQGQQVPGRMAAQRQRDDPERAALRGHLPERLPGPGRGPEPAGPDRRSLRRGWHPGPMVQRHAHRLARQRLRATEDGHVRKPTPQLPDGPGYWRVDASLFKRIALMKKAVLELRVEAVNLFN